MLHVGIAGLGFMGMIHYLAYPRVRGAKVAAICEQDAVRRAGDWRSIRGNFGPRGEKTDLRDVAQYGDLDALLADPQIDVVDVCLPTSLHADVAIRALSAGKHVLCEKPIALSPADAHRMVETARKHRRLLMIGHVLPFMPEYRFAYKTIADGTYGRLLGGHFKRIISDPRWMPRYYDPATIGGPMLDLHVHDAHFIRLVCGMPRAVQSVGSMRGEVVERFQTQFLFDDRAKVVTAASGVIAQPGRPFTHGFEIYLERATLLFDFAVVGASPVQAMPLTVLCDDGKVRRPKTRAGDAVAPFAAELAEMIHAIRSGKPSPFLDAALACDAVVLCQKQTEAVVSGRQVKVPRGG
jgi:predicted dehydrogenase